MFWNDYRWAVVNYLRDNPRSRKSEILEGVRGLLDGNGRHYLYWSMWNDTRDCLTRCTPPVLYRDESNRYVVSESGVLHWQQHDWEMAYNQARGKIRREIESTATCLSLDDHVWISRLQQKRAILRWVESHTPEEWWNTQANQANQSEHWGLPVDLLPRQVDKDISRAELLLMEG